MAKLPHFCKPNMARACKILSDITFFAPTKKRGSKISHLDTALKRKILVEISAIFNFISKSHYFPKEKAISSLVKRTECGTWHRLFYGSNEKEKSCKITIEREREMGDSHAYMSSHVSFPHARKTMTPKYM